jgi:hypothetical protein
MAVYMNMSIPAVESNAAHLCGGVFAPSFLLAGRGEHLVAGEIDKNENEKTAKGQSDGQSDSATFFRVAALQDGHGHFIWGV